MDVKSVHPADMKAASNNPEIVAAFEELASKWCKEIEQVCFSPAIHCGCVYLFVWLQTGFGRKWTDA